MNWEEQLKRLIEAMLGHRDFHGYNGYELILMCLGFIFWAFAYYHIIRSGFKNKRCEMPMIAATGNIAWEFCWSFLFHGDLGLFFTLGARIWFFLDLFINFQLLRYNSKLETNPWIRKNFYLIYLFSLTVWFLIMYFMVEDGDDNQLGVVTAMVTGLVMSALYIYQLVSWPQLRNTVLSYKVAWWKMLGSASVSCSCLILWPHNGFLLSLCGATFLLDLSYIYLFANYKPPIALSDVN